MTGGFFALLDDITLLLDDAASATKVAMNKTVGILGDDLAVNAEKAAKDFSASRELPVIWKITKGSVVNKIILLPLILFLSYYFPSFINPILFMGALYLAFEGAEKVLSYLMNVHHEEHQKRMTEKDKIKSAIFTDFILSIEIILITLSSVSNKPFLIQVVVLTIVSILATIFVYGLVAMIVRLDDTGYAMLRLSNQIKEKHIELNRTMKTIVSTLNTVGKSFVLSMPMVIKILTIVGTIAMLMVAGGIITHMFHITIQFHSHLIPEMFNIIIEIFIAMNLGVCAIFMEKQLEKFIVPYYKKYYYGYVKPYLRNLKKHK